MLTAIIITFLLKRYSVKELMKFFRVFAFTLLFVLKPISQNANGPTAVAADNSVNYSNLSMMERFINTINNKVKIGEVADLGAKIIPSEGNQSFELIIAKNSADFYTMDVYNLIGDKLIETDFFIGEEGQKFGADFNAGMYLVDIKNGEKVQRLKIFKQ